MFWAKGEMGGERIEEFRVGGIGPDKLYPDSDVATIGPVMLNGQKLIAAGVSLCLLIGLALFIKRSLWGRQIQAVAQNRLGASLAGIDATRTTSMAKRKPPKKVAPDGMRDALASAG